MGAPKCIDAIYMVHIPVAREKKKKKGEIPHRHGEKIGSAWSDNNNKNIFRSGSDLDGFKVIRQGLKILNN